MTSSGAFDTATESGPDATVAFVREELSELQAAGPLGPFEVRWAVEELIAGGVGLAEVLGVVFDFAEQEWLGQITTELTHGGSENALLEELVRRLAPEPAADKRSEASPAPLLEEVLPAGTGAHQRDAAAMGSEGIRQRPLRGWPL